MKIAIQGHPTRGNEVAQIFESLRGKNLAKHSFAYNDKWYYLDSDNFIICSLVVPVGYKEYTLEEFEKEFPFKIGDRVISLTTGLIGTIIKLSENGIYHFNYDNGIYSCVSASYLKLYKEMKEERNITLTLDKAKEWYKKGGELKEIALQAFSERELNSFPKSWEEYCRKHKSICLSTRYADNILLKYDDLLKLEQLRNCWWNGWEPDWNDDKQTKYCIVYYKGEFRISILCETRHFLSFPTMKMAEEFLKCFKDLIEKAGDLI